MKTTEKPAERTLDWYFDFISPFAYLQSEQLNRVPGNVSLRRRPILFAGLLNHWGSNGPAEIPSKRIFTYRHSHWLAQRHGIPFRIPPAHPFNPLKALRLAVALGGEASAVQTIFRFIWQDGKTTDDPQGWAALTRELGLTDAEAHISESEVKEQLRRNTEEAVARGVFGVPTFVVDDELFWGFDATDMLLDYLQDPKLFQTPEMQRISALPAAAHRRQA